MLTALLVLCAIGTTLSLPLLDTITPREGESCGYDSCPQTEAGVLNVHIVPHTHDDVGWLKTVDQYYYGSRNNIQKAGVQYILDSVVKELWQDEKRRFMYVETAFFWKWWTKQSDHVKQKVHTLVRQGRLQFVGGAWSMNDEASTHYQSTIDQFTWGLSKLNQTFGPCGRPTVGWQIDPFGHSREFANLLSAMGYDGLFLGRIDYQDKAERKRGKKMEMLWRGDDVTGKSSDIFTGVLYNNYSPPPGFCFDVLCNDEPIIDDPDSPAYNVDERVTNFLNKVHEMSLNYITNNILITMGDDFNYQDAGMWFTNLDKLIEYANMKAAKDGLNVKLFYSTPNCYLKAVKDANPKLPTKQDDFFPYASDPTAYWTGYFTSRPTTKYFEREGNAYLQTVKQLQVLAGLEDHNKYVLNELKSAMGVMQHHDAVTGTEKEHVTHDYERLLNEAIDDALTIARQAFNKYTQGDPLPPALLDFDRCHLNESSCATSENNDRFIVTVYNPVATTLEHFPVRIPVPDGAYSVYGPDGNNVKVQHMDLPPQVFRIPTRKSKATQEVLFLAKNLKGLSYRSYFVQARKHEVRKREAVMDKAAKNKHANYYNVNDYWKDIKDQSYVDMKNMEDSFKTNKDDDDSVLFITEEDSGNVAVNNNAQNEESKFAPDIDGYKDNVEALEELVQEARKELENIAKEARPRIEKNYQSLSEEEMRMLSDDPMVVERFDDESRNRLHVEKVDNGIRAVINNNLGKNIVCTMGLAYYPACIGNNEVYANRSSGAYIFRPNASESTLLNLHKIHDNFGPIVSESHWGNENFTMVLRSYNYAVDEFEVDWIVGPIPIDDGVGKEIVIAYQTDILNHGEFYTDSNGRQSLKRKLNKRPQYNVTLEEPIAGNYYPITNQIYIEDRNARVTVHTDRSHGGTSVREGVMEVMLHRRLLHDDAFGVGEALNETANGKGLVVRGKHLVKGSFIPVDEKRRVIPELYLPPQIFVSSAKNLDLDKWSKLKNEHGWLKQSLPEGVHLLTLEPWDGSNLLLRLENCLEKSNAASEVDLGGIFNNIKVKSFKETTLAGNLWVKDYNKWTWNKEKDFSESFNKEYGNFEPVASAVDDDDEVDDKGFTVKLKPGQIRTFVVDYEFIKN